ncbi:hypothetical protein QD460_24375 [Rhizobium jaguaris]|uniref:hypothetical protein n=1 Tax=Rhizobium jaguaris TaxID=1312183 RepID=UPI0039BF458A
MSDNESGYRNRPAVDDRIRRSKTVGVYMAVYAVFALLISSIFENEWLSLVLLCGFVAIGANHISAIYGRSSWPLGKDAKRQDKKGGIDPDAG